MHRPWRNDDICHGSDVTIESTMPTFDAMIAEHAMVAADPVATCQSGANAT